MLISALQHKSKDKSNSISNSFEKKIKFLGFHAVLLVKTFPLKYQLATNVGLNLTKLKIIQLFGTSQNSISNF